MLRRRFRHLAGGGLHSRFETATWPHREIVFDLLAFSDPAVLEPRFSLSVYPTHRLEMRVEGIDLLNGAIRPFGLDSPVLANA
jgi:hypothetical protein